MQLFNEISPKKLKELYWEKKLSSPKIGKIYHYDPKYVRFLFKKYSIKIRSKLEARQLLFNIPVSKKELKKLYIEKKMSSTEIAKKFNCSSAFIRKKLKKYHIPIRSCQEAHLLCNKPKYPRHDFDGNLEEKAYLTGFAYGDLHTYLTSQRSINVSVNSSKLDQLRLFRKLFSKFGHIWEGKPDKIKATFMRCYLNNTFSFLLNKKDLIESWILENTNCFSAFLSGYTDAEGTFCLCGGNAVFSIRSQDKNILHQIRNKLIKLGILLRPAQIARRKGTKDIRGTISNKDIWGIWIHRKDAIIKLIDLVNPYLKHADKRKRIKIIKNNIIQRNYKYNNQQDRKYYKLYLKEGIKI